MRNLPKDTIMFNQNLSKMRKQFLLILLAAISCFSLISCGDDKKDDPKPANETEVTDGSGTNVGTNPFAGNTYKVLDPGRDEMDFFAFSEKKVLWGDVEYDYTFDDNTITLSSRGYVVYEDISYTFSEDKNTLTLWSSAGITGNYIKQ